MKEDEEDEEVVWLPKSLAVKVKSLKDSDNFVLEYIRESKRELVANFDTLDDEIIAYKASMIKARKEFGIAKDEMIQSNYEVWEKFDNERKSVRDMATILRTELEPLKKDLKELEDSISKISTYRINDLFDTVHKISTMMQGETGEIIKFLINNFKK